MGKQARTMYFSRSADQYLALSKLHCELPTHGALDSTKATEMLNFQEFVTLKFPLQVTKLQQTCRRYVKRV